MSDKWPISLTNRLQESIGKDKQLNGKMGNMSKHITNKDIYITSENIKLHSISLIINKICMKITGFIQSFTQQIGKHLKVGQIFKSCMWERPLLYTVCKRIRIHFCKLCTGDLIILTYPFFFFLQQVLFAQQNCN